MSARGIRRAAAKRRAQQALVAGATAGAALAFAPVADAADFTVANTNDSGAGSLRQALDNANAAPDSDRILFAPSVTGTINLTTGELPIYEEVDIVGPGAGALTIDANRLSRIFYLDTSFGTSVSISGLGMTEGYETDGGALVSSGTRLTLTGVHVTSSEASDVGGGLVMDGGTVTVVDSTISGNTAGDAGGGILMYQGNIRISGSTISGNSGGFIGGGMAQIYGSATITNSTISGNAATGDPGTGGGIGLYATKYTEIESSTITNNSALAGGGGISTYEGSAAPVLHNTIVAGNTAATDADLTVKPEPGTLKVDASYSLIGSTQGADVRTTVAGSNVLNQGAALGPLADNGGPTRTHAIPKNSPAFDAGDPTNSLLADQRGIARPQFLGPDIGAFELQDTEAPATTIKGPRTKIKTRKKKVTVRADFLAGEIGSTFTCNLTGGELESDPGKCTSPLLYELPVGPQKKTIYALEVTATDATGNVGPPVTAKTTVIEKPKRGKRK